MTPDALTTELKQEALRLGFDLVGATPAIDSPDLPYLDRWLADGFAADMHWIAGRAEAYAHPRHVLEGAQSLLMLAVVYRTVEPAAAGPGQGLVSRYAWGDDYHDVLRERLHALADFHRRLTPGAAVRGVVDTAPLLERQFARLAGLGWIGKNTLLLNQQHGSWLLLAALLTTSVLTYDEPLVKGHCGTCRACIDACPTGALVEPHRLDARKCISYLTIESRSATPAELRRPCGQRVFGCDACQAVCPWNRKAPPTGDPHFAPRPGMNPLELAPLLAMDEKEFRQQFRGSPLLRPKSTGLQRNAAVVLENERGQLDGSSITSPTCDADRCRSIG